MKKKDIFYMQKAILQAKLGLKKGEVPVGAVVVNTDGNILSRAYNKIEKNKSQLAHAEILAIQKACRKRGDWRLDNCTLYVTLEPCLMCLGLIKLCRIKKVYYGAKSTFSFKKNGLEVISGLKENESLDILRLFFKQLRKKGKVTSETKGRIT